MSMHSMIHLILILVVSAACKPSNKDSFRLKNGTATSASVQIFLNPDRRISLVHNHPPEGPDNFRATNVQLSSEPIVRQMVDLNRVSDGKVMLQPVSFRLQFDAVSGARRLSCNGTQINFGGQTVKLSCLRDGEGNFPDSGSQTITNFRLPQGMTDNLQRAWSDMASACLSGSGNVEFGGSNKILSGCFCARPGVQINFRDYESLVSTSPDAAVNQFKMDCSTPDSRRPKLLQQLASKCLDPTGQGKWTNGPDGCGCSSSVRSIVIPYAEYFAIENPLDAFEGRLRSECGR